MAGGMAPEGGDKRMDDGGEASGGLGGAGGVGVDEERGERRTSVQPTAGACPAPSRKSPPPRHSRSSSHPGGDPGANLKSISHRCYLWEVAFEWELTKETIYLPLGCLQGGSSPLSILKDPSVCHATSEPAGRSRRPQTGCNENLPSFTSPESLVYGSGVKVYSVRFQGFGTCWNVGPPEPSPPWKGGAS